jgi:tRNA pseudouridine55 synthase
MTRQRRGRDVSGFFLLDKPSGPTSNQVLQRVRRLFDARKAGHTGTLDPLATGMLPVCFGAATRTAAQAIAADKHYEATALLGSATDTADAQGQVIETAVADHVDAGLIGAVLERFTGDIEQVPPRYSAVKHNGRRLYELARAGIDVPRSPRTVTIHQLELARFEAPYFTIRARCSKGTYIRTLIEDIAKAVETLAHVTALRRLSVDPFNGQPMVTLAALEAEESPLARAQRYLLPVDCVLTHLPSIEVPAAQTRRLCQGQKIQLSRAPDAGRFRIYDSASGFVGIGDISTTGELFPKRIFL